MTDPDLQLLERELAYYRRECNDIGGRLLRLQEEQSRTAREARRARTVAHLIREAYQLANRDIAADHIGEPILSAIADISVCDRAAFLLEDAHEPGRFQVEHAIGVARGAGVTIGHPPAFLYTASGLASGQTAEALTALLGVPYLLWAYDPASRRALLLGSHSESNLHRAFEPGDQELVQGALSVYVDVLLRKLAETTLRQAKTAAEEANDARARFLATLTHELRTPLNAVIGFSELLLDSGPRAPDHDQRHEFAGEILDAGQRLLLLVNDILDYSSLSHAAPKLRLGWVPAAQLLQAAVRAFAADSAARALDVGLKPGGPDIELLIDYDRFRQILNNLIGNAVKFTQPGGRVVVTAELGHDDAARIVVRDSGIGMRPDDIPRALEPFVQLENMLRRRFRGTGLGLPIAKQLAEAHGGALTISSTHGEGTEVIVTLPRGSTRQMVTSIPA